MKYLYGALLILLSWGALAEEAKPKVAESLQELQLQIAAEVKEKKLPGVQLALFDKNGVYWSAEFGIRDKEKQLSLEPDTLMRAGSTTKTFVSLAIMQLIGEGKFELQAKLQDIAPEVKIDNPWRKQYPVRVVHLLEHTAGFDDMHFRNFYNVNELDISLLDAVNRDATALKVRWQPGTMHSYSNPGYGILGYLIEKYSGQKHEDYLQQNILKPIGMSNSSLRFNKTVEAKLSQGFSDGEAVVHREIYLRSAGSLYTTAIDLAKVGHFLLTEAKSAQLEIINADVIHSMEHASTTLSGKSGLDYGYGRGVYQAIRGNRLWYGHNGGLDGFFSSYGYSRQFGQGYALMLNSSSDSVKKLLTLITQFLAKDVPFVAQNPVEGIDPSINGYYRIRNSRNEILAGVDLALNVVKLVAKGDKLIAKPLIGDDVELIHVGQQQFKDKDNEVATAIFIENTEGNKAFEIDGQYFIQTNFLLAWLPIVFIATRFFNDHLDNVFVSIFLFFPHWQDS